MDYEDGEPLDVLLGRHETLTEAQLKRVLLPVADGLRQVHAAGFVHRDAKPANIFGAPLGRIAGAAGLWLGAAALGGGSRSVTARFGRLLAAGVVRERRQARAVGRTSTPFPLCATALMRQGSAMGGDSQHLR